MFIAKLRFFVDNSYASRTRKILTHQYSLLPQYHQITEKVEQAMHISQAKPNDEILQSCPFTEFNHSRECT